MTSLLPPRLLSNSKKTYKVFRKPFHVPSSWASNENFMKLMGYNYSTTSVSVAFKTISDAFSDLGYLEDNSAMVHDYLHYMTKDLLIKNNRPFIEENDLKKVPALQQFFEKLTPDLIVETTGKLGVKGVKAAVIDFYVGNNSQAIADKKSKYRQFGSVGFTFTVITPYNLGELKTIGILDSSDVDYLDHQFRIFQCEYQYWYSCVKLQKILFNERENMQIQPDVKAGKRFKILQDHFIAGITNICSTILRFRDEYETKLTPEEEAVVRAEEEFEKKEMMFAATAR